MYKVLWLDDEHQKFQPIKDEALLEDVQLIGYTNASDGGIELSRNHKHYDAVILDGLFLRNEDSDITSVAFGDVAKILSELKSKGIVKPWFIYSGQPSFVKDKNNLVEVFKDNEFAAGKVFDKSKEDDFIQLLNEIKKCADENPVRQIKLKNQEVFSIFDSGLLDDDQEQELLDLFFELDKIEGIDFKAVFTKIRSLQEKIFIKLENLGVLQGKQSFSNKCKHLSGNIMKDASGKFAATSEVYQTSEIENLQKWIYFTCGTYIHALELQHYGGYMISHYALKSLFYGLLELLLWFKKTYNLYK